MGTAVSIDISTNPSTPAAFGDSLVVPASPWDGEEAFRFRLFAESALEMIDSLVLKLDPQGNILDMNAACRRGTGFEPAEVRGQPLVNVLAVAREVEAIQEKFRKVKRLRADGRDTMLRFESSMLTKAGAERFIAWSLKAVRDQTGTILYLVMTGVDRTRWVEAASQSGLRRRRAGDRLAPPTGHGTPSAAAARRDATAGHGVTGLLSDVAKTTGGNDAGPLREGPEPPSEIAGVSVPPSRPSERTPVRVGKDLRSSPRRTFRCRQRIAPTFGGQLPGPDDFFEVECKDISAGGIAIRLNCPPDFETLVVALGKPPRESYVSARVVRCAPAGRDGEAGYVVGCCFTGKVSL
jgi:PAS domain S-box-containing protein